MAAASEDVQRRSAETRKKKSRVPYQVLAIGFHGNGRTHLYLVQEADKRPTWMNKTAAQRCSSSLAAPMATLRNEWVARQRCKIWDGPDDLVTCYVDPHDEDDSWIVCACDVCFHKECVGVQTEEEVAEWRCPVCLAISLDVEEEIDQE